MFSKWFSGEDRERYLASPHKHRIDHIGRSLLELRAVPVTLASSQANLLSVSQRGLILRVKRIYLVANHKRIISALPPTGILFR
jgi:hypothetical protein